MKYINYHDTLIGKLRLVEEDGAIIQLVLDRIYPPIEGEQSGEETPLLRRVKEQLDEYFAGTRREFDLPIRPKGTAFQLRDWAELQKIPYGETRTYKDIAEAIGCPKGYRAVGLANNRNPVIILIPCHRVVGSNGKLVGYAGGVDLKEKLLEIEGIR
jgi:methylated-DNA-[protein]-cysteine S-methyltransferase